MPGKKTLSCVAIFLMGLLPGLVPLILRRQSHRLGKHILVLSLLNCFSAGVFMGVGTMHLLPEAWESWNDILGAREEPFPVPFCLVGLGFYLVLVLERVLFWGVGGSSSESKPRLPSSVTSPHPGNGTRALAAGNAEATAERSLSVEDSSQDMAESAADEDMQERLIASSVHDKEAVMPICGEKSHSHLPRHPIAPPVAGSSDWGAVVTTSPLSTTTIHHHHHHHHCTHERGHGDLAMRIAEQDVMEGSGDLNGISERTPLTATGNEAHDSDDGTTSNLEGFEVEYRCEHPGEAPQRYQGQNITYRWFGSSKASRGKGALETLRHLKSPLLMLAAVSMHSILAGIVLGLQKSVEGLVTMLIAILSHKGSAAIAVSVRIVRSNADMSHAIAMILLFASTTPLGVLIGYFVGTSNLYVQMVFNSLACGTFLYIGGSEVVEDELALTSAALSKDSESSCGAQITERNSSENGGRALVLSSGVAPSIHTTDHNLALRHGRRRSRGTRFRRVRWAKRWRWLQFLGMMLGFTVVGLSLYFFTEPEDQVLCPQNEHGQAHPGAGADLLPGPPPIVGPDTGQNDKRVGTVPVGDLDLYLGGFAETEGDAVDVYYSDYT